MLLCDKLCNYGILQCSTMLVCYNCFTNGTNGTNGRKRKKNAKRRRGRMKREKKKNRLSFGAIRPPFFATLGACPVAWAWASAAVACRSQFFAFLAASMSRRRFRQCPRHPDPCPGCIFAPSCHDQHVPHSRPLTLKLTRTTVGCLIRSLIRSLIEVPTASQFHREHFACQSRSLFFRPWLSKALVRCWILVPPWPCHPYLREPLISQSRLKVTWIVQQMAKEIP